MHKIIVVTYVSKPPTKDFRETLVRLSRTHVLVSRTAYDASVLRPAASGRQKAAGNILGPSSRQQGDKQKPESRKVGPRLCPPPNYEALRTCLQDAAAGSRRLLQPPRLARSLHAAALPPAAAGLEPCKRESQ